MIEIYGGDGDEIEDEAGQILEIMKIEMEIVDGYGDEVVEARRMMECWMIGERRRWRSNNRLQCEVIGKEATQGK